jgi:GTP-dependent phosphoenolpyruvate carboxykinase
MKYHQALKSIGFAAGLLAATASVSLAQQGGDRGVMAPCDEFRSRLSFMTRELKSLEEDYEGNTDLVRKIEHIIALDKVWATRAGPPQPCP